MSTATRETTITADPAVPTILIAREFDAPVANVFRAHVEADLVRRWLGPRGLTMEIDRWDAQTGGGYRYTHRDENGEYRFYGSFHEVRPDERIVQTFTFEGFPDGVSLETVTFTDLGDGRTRLEALSVVDSMEARDAMLSSGMDVGVKEGYEQLDELLENGAA
ncbi:SRPBCC family protein [Actinomycetospora chlora]|uniref:SRPBCC family protein n=1 Tax=Actinomycetospora chlora TaxID=663608 RepID=A0ABP9CEB2_9PSEU